MNGSPGEMFLGLSEAEQRAVALIQSPSNGALCTGTIVADGWVLTAAHCSALLAPEVLVPTRHGDRLAFPVLDTFTHPALDAALLHTGSLGKCVDVAPLPPLEDVVDDTWTGARVELAGYGLTEAGTSGSVRFVVESIAAVEPESVVVDGQGRSGACLGDSGGPLLVRNREGVVGVAGLLTTGSASCVNRDRFVRIDVLRGWLAAWLDFEPVYPRSCGGVSSVGTCTRESAVWCAGGTLAHELCGADRSCGWDETGRGFRCVPPEADACDGSGAHGACIEGNALNCSGGVLERTPCEDRGLDCVYSEQSGRPRCDPR